MTVKSNGLLAREKGQSLACDVIDAFSNDDCPEARCAWFKEAMFDLVELPRLDSVIHGFVEELAPVLAAGHSVEANIGAAERDKALVELYAHPDGEQVFFCKKSNRLMAWVTGDNPAYVEIPIGPNGLRHLAADLLNVANELEAE
ncbi:hypothetical protein [Malikia sp.]|uniref:hypothetical protein n=1 Tax=Malikia sp. TaxID=2070706 RepID=UPI00262E4655|nr:hypothetical protein [Malikia sp.]MDD2729309.1 hypothetical protein [Malikia sp.]